MKRTSANLKALARAALLGNFGLPVSGYLLITVATSVLSMVLTGFLDFSSTVSIVTSQILVYLFSLLSSLLMAGYNKMLLNLSRKMPYSLKDILYTFSHNPDRFIVVNFLMLLAGILVSLPFDLPSYTSTSMNAMLLSLMGILVRSLMNIILGAFFGLANYLLLDYPEMGAMEAMKESLRLMKGNKGRYLYLYLSFLPLTFVCTFTCYIGILWLLPYMQTTLAFFYMDITGELDTPVIESGNVQDDIFNQTM